MHLTIHLYGNPILNQPGTLIVNFDDWLKKFANKMIETLHKTNASGLAAQHVGYAIQLCVIDILDTAKKLGEKLTAILDDKEVPLNLLMPLIIVNPELMPTSSKKVSYVEGSVSFPGIAVPITRPELIYLKFQDIQGIRHELKCGGILARCILHEYDQLCGILFIDRAQQADLISHKSKLKKLKQNSHNSQKTN